MANVNKVILIGNLIRDPELRYTPSGTAVVEFGIAVNRRWKSKEGQQTDETMYIDCQAWAKSAEVMSEHLRKGYPIYIEGRLQFEQWEGRDGQKCSKHRVTVEQFQFIDNRKGENSQQGTTTAPPPPNAAENAPQGQMGANNDESDMPF